MFCDGCKTNKLSREFPGNTLSENCDHHVLHCLECTLAHVRTHRKCPGADCSILVEPDCREVRVCELQLRALYGPLLREDDEDEEDEQALHKITCRMFDGSELENAYAPDKRIDELRQKIGLILGVDEDNIKLIYKGKTLQDRDRHTVYTLASYQIPAGAELQLIVIKYRLPPRLNHVVFDLSSCFPTGKKDALVASCLAYSGATLRGYVDYRVRRHEALPAVEHTGDEIDLENNKVHQRVSVRVRELADDVTALVFTLSAWNLPTIGHYPSPQLRLFDAQQPQQPLCNTVIREGLPVQAVIMAVMSRDHKGQWVLTESKAPSAGTAENYEPLLKTVEKMLKENYLDSDANEA